jgi:hypothetical protein
MYLFVYLVSYCSLFNGAFSVTGCTTPKGMMNGVLTRMCKWPKVRYYPGICLEE